MYPLVQPKLPWCATTEFGGIKEEIRDATTTFKDSFERSGNLDAIYEDGNYNSLQATIINLLQDKPAEYNLDECVGYSSDGQLYKE
jgi:hypothetical protein